MNNVFTAKLLNNLRNKKAETGFTLIELLVVVIIVGVLAAVALPNLLGQVGKARETEATTTVGAVNRAQMANRMQRPTFASGVTLTSPDNLLGVVAPANSNFDYEILGDADIGTVTATDDEAADNGVRNYAGAVTFNAGAFESLVCQSDTVGGTVGHPTGAGDDACGEGVTAIR